METLKQGKLVGKQNWRSIRKWGKEDAWKWADEEKKRREEEVAQEGKCRVSDESRGDCTTYSLKRARKCGAAELQYNVARTNAAVGVRAGIREIKQRQKGIESVADTGQEEQKAQPKAKAKVKIKAKAKSKGKADGKGGQAAKKD